MSDRKELIKAMLVLKKHCEESLCGTCIILRQCNTYFAGVNPFEWNIQESEVDK